MNSKTHTLLMLSGESTVPVELLTEDEQLMRLLSLGTSYDNLLSYINENF